MLLLPFCRRLMPLLALLQGIELPEFLQTVLDALGDVVDGAAEALPGVACSVGGTFPKRLLFKVALPIALLLGILLSYHGRVWWLHHRTMPIVYEKGKSFRAKIARAVINMQMRENCCNWAFAVVYLLYPSTSTTILETFYCRKITDGEREHLSSACHCLSLRVHCMTVPETAPLLAVLPFSRRPEGADGRLHHHVHDRRRQPQPGIPAGERATPPFLALSLPFDQRLMPLLAVLQLLAVGLFLAVFWSIGVPGFFAHTLYKNRELIRTNPKHASLRCLPPQTPIQHASLGVCMSWCNLTWCSGCRRSARSARCFASSSRTATCSVSEHLSSACHFLVCLHCLTLPETAP